ncbi:hypothetical protein CVT26_006167 [Gymnopilus dilepis]|uniref:Uncharacterized protein n=1 Tax=Gymnopilus dilepis TaxID=231916 RepID=A0A409WRE9_9AGAR|nr:hypothetical protein CVT26_006167 [Gymnopilus dilepis]
MSWNELRRLPQLKQSPTLLSEVQDTLRLYLRQHFCLELEGRQHDEETYERLFSEAKYSFILDDQRQLIRRIAMKEHAASRHEARQSKPSKARKRVARAVRPAGKDAHATLVAAPVLAQPRADNIIRWSLISICFFQARQSKTFKGRKTTAQTVPPASENAHAAPAASTILAQPRADNTGQPSQHAPPIHRRSSSEASFDFVTTTVNRVLIALQRHGYLQDFLAKLKRYCSRRFDANRLLEDAREHSLQRVQDLVSEISSTFEPIDTPWVQFAAAAVIYHA